MSLILCRNEPVKQPLYIEKLGVHIYSSQELCYVIYQYPLLALNGFVDENLVEFIAVQLDMGVLAVKMEKWRKGGGGEEDLLLLILQECGYYSAAEINKYKQQLAAYRKMRREEFDKATADFYYSLKQYRAAIDVYEKILNDLKGTVMDDEFAARIWNNIGASYAGIFWFEKAMQAYDMSYGFSRSIETLKRIFQLTLFAPQLQVKERYHQLITDELKAQWTKELEDVREEAKRGNEVGETVMLFLKDPIKRTEACEQRLAKWKQAYRAMI